MKLQVMYLIIYSIPVNICNKNEPKEFGKVYEIDVWYVYVFPNLFKRKLRKMYDEKLKEEKE